MPYRGLGDAHEASLYRTLVKDLPEYAIFRIGVNGVIESWNTGVELLLGYTEPEFLGLPFSALFTPEDLAQDASEQELLTAADQGRASDVRWHLRKDGSRFFCDGMVTPIRGDNLKLIGFTKVMHDVTARKLAEQETAELICALDLTHTIVREVDGTVVRWTQGAEFMYGWSREEALGRRTHDLLQTRFPEPLSAINERLLELGEWQGELHHQTKDGREVTVASHWILHSRADDQLHIIEVNNDISKLQAAQSDLRRANAELASFASEVAHDIQAPIRGVTALSELLASKLQSIVCDQDLGLLRGIAESSLKLRNLVQSLLEYATGENASEEVETFSVNDVLQEVRANLFEIIASADLSWGAMPVLRGHRSRILRLLQNLVANAIKYARPSVPPVVRVSATLAGSEWRFDVEDNGTGIPSHQSQRIFAPLTRLHGTDVPGTGLGLAICKRIVEGEGGRIWVDSVVGEGSVFHVTFPTSAT